MNCRYPSKRFRALVLASTTLIALSGISLQAQPSGETITGVAIFGLYKFEGTGRDFTLSLERTSQATGNNFYQSVLSWRAPAGREIKGFNVKKGNSEVVFILLDDGSVYETISSTFPFSAWSTPMFRSKTDPSGNYAGFTKMVGDALYTLSGTAVFISRDTAKTWSLDTAGVGTGLYNDIAVDTLQYVYLAHNAGLFKQNPDSSVWHKVTSFPGSAATSVFVDRTNRIYASTYGAIYLSTNGGSTWTTKSAGFTASSVTQFTDDAFRTIYALGGGMVFRSDSGTNSWVRIDTSISKLIHDPISSFSSPFTSISGDTNLFLGTTYGMFRSTNRGNSWSEANSDVRAATLYGYYRTPSQQFVATGLGLYTRALNDTAWTKVFPSSGYQTGGPIYSDNAGELFTLGPIINSNNSQSPNSNWKSTDNGTTWLPDTLGLGLLKGGSIPKYFADETGAQHYAVSGIPVQCYKKGAGGSWTADTSGWSVLPGNFPNVIASDLHGFIYTALTTTTDYTGLLLKRPIAGGTWVLDTAGLQKAIIYSISVDPGGNLYAGTFGNGIYKRTGSTWASISSPGGLNGNDAFVTAVNKSGVLFAGFAYQSGFNYNWQGVYASTNSGGSWTKLGLDSIAVKMLIPYGDSVYAVTYYDGLYLLTKSAVTAISSARSSAPMSFQLFQNYPNPFNPATTIEFSTGRLSIVDLKIYDLLGREVATLVKGEMSAGKHEVQFDASHLASGIYFYRLQAGGYVSIRKLMVLK